MSPVESKPIDWRKWVTTLGWLALAIVFAWAGPMRGGCENNAWAGKQAVNFSLPVVSGDGASEGDRIELKNLKGKIVLLDFWASWCGPCRQAVPIFNRLRDKHGARGFEAIGINVEYDLSTRGVARAHGELGATFPTVHDQDNAVMRRYKVESLPTWILIGGDGTILERGVGVPNEGRLDDKISSNLK